MTTLYVLVPVCELAKQTNNSQLIKKLVQDRYPCLQAHQILWIQSNKNASAQSQKPKYECAIKIPQIQFHFDQILQSIQSKNILEQTISRLKNDIFNLVKAYDVLYNSKKENEDKFKPQFNGEDEGDVSLSLRIQKNKQAERGQQRYYKQEQLLKSISDLTRQNIKLKDVISYYEAQVQYLIKGNEAQNDKNIKQNK